MRKGHTIIELLVAMGLLAAIIAGSGVVFKGAIDAHRTANATAEVSRKLRTITEQLDADFAGLRKDGEIAVKFVKGGSDQIMFFSDGNFEAYNATFTGNMARVYYGAANLVDWDGAGSQFNVLADYAQSGLLARRQHILSAAGFGFPNIDRDGFDGSFVPFVNTWPFGNNGSEFDELTLENWKSHCNVADIEIGDLAIEQIVVDNMNKVFETCFADSGRAGIDIDKQGDDINGPDTFQLLMSQGVGEFKVAFEYFNGGQLYWWPSEQIVPHAVGPDMSDYDFAGADQFGVFFNMGYNLPTFDDIDSEWDLAGNWGYSGVGFPRALKFTFTLYDSNGVFSGGKTFSHIVYLAN